MSLNVLPALFRYTNGAALCVGTIRSRKPSLLMSPQMGLPQESFASETKPASFETSRNCWPSDADERAATDPAAVARHRTAFLRPNETRRQKFSVILISNISSCANEACVRGYPA